MSAAAIAFAALLVVAWLALTLAAVGQSLLHGIRDWHDARRHRRPGYLPRR